MYKAVIFDLDGTLLDTLDDLASAVNYALSTYSLPQRSREEICSFIGNGAKKLILRASENDARSDEILESFRLYYKEHSADTTKPYEDVLEMLSSLKEKGIKTAVLSNKPDFLTTALSKKYFGDLIGFAQGEKEHEGIPRKPAPDALFSVMETLGVAKEETVYVGDSDVDIKTAKNAGVDCISVTWGFKSKAFLEENGATHLANTTAQVLRFCGVEI